ncbi:MAG: hypothetical protein LC790_09180, partial [Actinobacteria bacterium]|nr:hypothetical protein [Actinomycetota bacterium]
MPIATLNEAAGWQMTELIERQPSCRSHAEGQRRRLRYASGGTRRLISHADRHEIDRRDNAYVRGPGALTADEAIDKNT